MKKQPIQLTRNDKLSIAAQAFTGMESEKFWALFAVMAIPGFLLHRMKVRNAILQRIANALSEAGVPTDATYGSIMGILLLNKKDLRDQFCFFKRNKFKLTGQEIIDGLRAKMYDPVPLRL